MTAVSQRITITMANDLHEVCRSEAAQYALSLSAYISQVLRQRHALTRELPAKPQPRFIDAARQQQEGADWGCDQCGTTNPSTVAQCNGCFALR